MKKVGTFATVAARLPRSASGQANDVASRKPRASAVANVGLYTRKRTRGPGGNARRRTSSRPAIPRCRRETSAFARSVACSSSRARGRSGCSRFVVNRQSSADAPMPTLPITRVEALSSARMATVADRRAAPLRSRARGFERRRSVSLSLPALDQNPPIPGANRYGR